MLDHSGFVLRAWELAKSCYAGPAIIAHTEQDFHDLIKGAVPMLLAACGLVLTTTLLGAGVGALFGGVGAAPGAAAGFTIGTTLLEALGLGFLAVYLKDRVGDIAKALYGGASMAWKSCGDGASIDAAARQMAEAVGLFYAALLQAILLYLGSALAGRTLTASRRALRGSKLFQSCAELEAWLTKNFAELYEKHVGKPAPGLLPPVTTALSEWRDYIQSMKLEAPPRGKGALWSKIGADRAKVEASKRGMVTLEMLLEKNGFTDAYTEVFGTSAQPATKDTTWEIWKLLSTKYARSLQGTVTAFVDDPALAKAIRESPAKLPIKDLAAGEEALPKAPQITRELMEISDVMEENPNISIVEIRDISNPDIVIKTMSREYVLQSKRAPLQ